MDKMTRRRFLEDAALLLAAASVPAGEALAGEARHNGRRIGPNDQIRIACIGVNGRGMDHVRSYAGMNDVTIAAICDPDTAAWSRAVKAVEDKGKPAPKTVKDLRRIMEDKEIDAVSIATPNHWHSLAAIWAMQAGKDVYVEKPVSHNVFEGRRMVEAARRYNRICQGGTQSRSSKGLREAMEFLHADGIGHIYLAHGLCYKARGSIGKAGGMRPVPETVGEEGYNLWLGPAPQKPVTRVRFHYDWHWLWDYGNGDLGNQGVHEMDKARWGLNKRGLPKTALGLGGRFGYEDDGETPNTQIALFDYGDSQLIFEVRGLIDNKKGGTDDYANFRKPSPLSKSAVGNVFYGTEGVMVMPSYSDAVVFDKSGNKVREFHGGGEHYRNFLNAMRSRKRSELNAEVEEGHYSAALCHLANISYRLGTQEPFDIKRARFGDNEKAYEFFSHFEEHLAANGVKLANATYRLGRQLHINAARETCGSDQEANALLTREYRTPFVVPKKV